MGLGHHGDAAVKILYLSAAGQEGIQVSVIGEQALRGLEKRLAAVAEPHAHRRAELVLIVLLRNGRAGELEVFQHVEHGPPGGLLLDFLPVVTGENQHGPPFREGRAGVGEPSVQKADRPQVVLIGHTVLSQPPEEAVPLRPQPADVLSR